MSSSPFSRVVDLIRQKVQVVEVPPRDPEYRPVPGGCHYVWTRADRRRQRGKGWGRPGTSRTGALKSGERTPQLARWR